MDQKLKSALSGGGAVKPLDLARALDVSPGFLYKALQRGEVQSVRIGRRIIIPEAEARRLLRLEPASE